MPATCFRAILEGKQEQLIFADNGANANNIDSRTLERAIMTGADANVETPSNPKISDIAEMALNCAKVELVCDSVISIDIKLQIRHGSGLFLRN